MEKMEIVFIVFSIIIVLGLIYYFFIHDLFNKEGKKVIHQEPVKILPTKKSTPSESYKKDYSLYDGDVQLRIKKEESHFIKTIVRSHRVVTPEPDAYANTVTPKENTEVAATPSIDFDGSAFDSYEANLDHILFSTTDSNIIYPELKDLTIIKGENTDKNPVSISDIIYNHLENQTDIEKQIFNELEELRLETIENDAEPVKSEILEDFYNNYEKISDNKENILNFMPDKSNPKSESNDSFLDFDNLDFDETV